MPYLGPSSNYRYHDYMVFLKFKTVLNQKGVRWARLTKVVRVRYEGVLKPLEELDLGKGEELIIVIKGKSFYEMVREF